jgi:hypothetical protein
VATSRGPQSPAGKIALGVVTLLLAAACAVFGLRETRLTCTPEACETVKSFPASRSRRDLADIHGVEIRESSGKQRGVFIVSVIDTRGASIRVHSSGKDGAETFKRELEELLAGQRQRIEVVTPPAYWMLVFGALLAVFAVYEIREAIRGWGKYVRPARPKSARNPLVLVGALGVGAMVLALAGNFILERSMADSTGVLQLECRHRCEFQGMTCLPGGAMEMRLNPGEYDIKVWNPAAPDSWEPHKFRVEVGAETRFVCEPGR